MNLKRILQHAIAMPWQARRTFSKSVCDAIEQAIAASEKQHLGEIRFVVENQLPWHYLSRNTSARHRAIDLFSQLRLWDTEHNVGVLVYVLFAERQIEIVADRGIDARVSQNEWDAICNKIAADFRQGRFEHGAVSGLQGITALLLEHFPGSGKNTNELANSVVLL